MENHKKISRRQLIKGVGGLLLAASLSKTPNNISLASTENQNVNSTIVGIVQSTFPTKLIVRTIESQDIEVTVDPSAFISRGDSDTTVRIGDFVVGDEVVAIGLLRSHTMVANELTTMYRFLEGSIISRNGNKIETTGGTAYLTSDTQIVQTLGFIEKPLQEIGPGDEIVADCWIASDMFRMARVGILETG
jgi:hypothetical protein